MKELTLNAYAKINLGLKIQGKREDGYHLISTLYQRIDLHDQITLILSDKGGIDYQGPQFEGGEENNLCLKAARLFQAHWGIWGGVRIVLDKEIPVGAGLGGGSSDGAAVLKGLALLHNIPLNHPALFNLALNLGADVPFFLSDLSAAYGEGIGDVLKPSSGLKENLWISLLHPGYPISTGWAYRNVDHLLTERSDRIKIEISWFRDPSEDWKWLGINDFESLVFSHYPELKDARDQLKRRGSIWAGLTGSGSAVYGIFDDEVTARAALSQWQPPWRCLLCRPY